MTPDATDDPAAAAILIVDDVPETRERMRAMLERRFGSDYRVVGADSPQSAHVTLDELAKAQTDVMLILARHGMAARSGVDFLSETYPTVPDARRVVVLDVRELTRAREDILRAAAVGEIDTYLSIPRTDRDEPFFRAVGQFIEDWAREHRPQTEVVRIVGDRWDPEVQHLRDALHRSGVTTGFYDANSDEGRHLLSRAGSTGPLPVVMTLDDQALSRPSRADVAELLEVNADPRGREFDVVIVGAGPAGLSAAVYASSEGLACIVVEGEALGGQASTSSLIRNYLGFPRGLTGSDLASRAYLQAWFFGAQFHLGRAATALRVEDASRAVILEGDVEIRAKSVVLAAGVSYRRLGIESVERFEGRGVFYGAPVTEAWAVAGGHAVVVGGGNSSAQSALYLSRWADRVTLVARRETLDEMSDYLVREIAAHTKIEVRLGTVVVDAAGEARLQTVTLRKEATGTQEAVEAAALFVLIGADPGTDWLPPEIDRDDRGYVVTGKDVTAFRDPRRGAMPYETTVPGVFAVGDVRLGGMKRVAAAVGEGSSAIRQVHTYLAERSHEHPPAPDRRR